MIRVTLCGKTERGCLNSSVSSWVPNSMAGGDPVPENYIQE